jgi:hypothetical protein
LAGSRPPCVQDTEKRRLQFAANEFGYLTAIWLTINEPRKALPKQHTLRHEMVIRLFALA